MARKKKEQVNNEIPVVAEEQAVEVVVEEVEEIKDEVPPVASGKEEVTILSAKEFECNGQIFSYPSKSKMFVELYLRGYQIGEIAAETSSHYSFVYGVIDKYVGVERQETTSKATAIRELAASGLTPGQIAKQLNSNYSYVHSVVKKYKELEEVANV